MTKTKHRFLNSSISARIVTGFYKLDGLKPQTRAIVQHMARGGSITQREALLDHGVQSLTRRITEIKDEGIAVLKDRRVHPVTGQRYTRYSLVRPQLVTL